MKEKLLNTKFGKKALIVGGAVLGLIFLGGLFGKEEQDEEWVEMEPETTETEPTEAE